MNSKKLTKLELYWYIIGGSIGSGLFVLLPISISYTGKSAVVAIFIAALVVACSQLYNIVVSSLFPLKGGDYSQIAFLSSPLISGVYGMIWLLSCLTLSGYATSTVIYASSVITGFSDYSKLIAILILTFFFGLNYFGTKFVAKFQSVFTIILLISLALFIFAGLPKVDYSSYLNDSTFFLNGFSGFSAAIGVSIWAFQGPAVTAVGLASEVDESTKTIPKAILVVLLLISIFYALIVLVASGVTTVDIASSKDFTAVANEIFPYGLFVVFVFGGAIFALITSLISNITIFRYPFEQLAEEGWLPSVFKKKTKNGWPYVGVITMYFCVMIPILFDISFDTVIAYSNISAYLIILYANFKCISLPKKHLGHWKKSIIHMRLTYYYALCALSIVSSIYILYCVCAGQTLTNIIIGFGLAALFFFYSYFRLKKEYVDTTYLQNQKEAIINEIVDYDSKNENL